MTAELIGHKAISASAGSGKTFQLAHRYIELMSKGVKPDRIIALTFSRKAAGEIFDSVVRYLCQAASSPEAALRTGRLIGKPDTRQHEFLHILRELLESLHRLHIGTLDSFTVGVAKTFPMELGIPPRFQLLGEDGAAGVVRQQVLARVFSQREANQALRSEFLEAYKQVTFGREEKELGERLDALIRENRGYYQVLPAASAWGHEDRIWAGSSPWWKGTGDVEATASHLTDLLRQDGLSESAMKRWETFIGAVRKFGVGSTWPDAIDYLFVKLSPHIESLQAGDLSFKMDKASQHLSREECRLALALMAHVMNTEMAVALQKTQGIYRVLDLYEGFYDAMLRRQGRLTFTDVQYLLTAGNRASGGLVMSRMPSAEMRLYIDYRLDCKLDHWLLDEFQDTSDLQWEVLSNLADEILQDNSGQRSFFYVGDAKQSIYGWRGGNAKLFNSVLDRYGEHIELSHLSTSFRSCQVVVDTVNRVFGAMPADLLPQGAVAQWQRVWQVHRCEEGAVPKHGYAAVLEPPCDGGRVKPGDEDRYGVVAQLLREIEPLKRGLSVAVLVRTNKSGNEMVDFLRRECSGMRIVHEGTASIKDNPVVAALLSLVKFAAHPADTYAWRHLQMSPLRGYFARERLTRDHLPLLLLRELQTNGFQSLIRNWGDRLGGDQPLDAFGQKRLNELVNAAIEFDETGSRDCNAFLRSIDSYQIHDLATDDAVRVMTIHQSKGLGFDMVILPDLQTENMARGRQTGFVLAREPVTGKPAWALEMPQRIVAENDAVLDRQLALEDEKVAFDALCLLYVAMTRAKKGLYIVTSFPGGFSKVLTPAAFVKQQLTGDTKPVEGKPLQIGGEDVVCLYEVGDPQWHAKTLETARQPAPVEAAQLPPGFRRQPSVRRRLVHVQPSQRADIIHRADSLFALGAQDNLDLGTAIHQLFEKVSWIGEVDAEALIMEWSEASSMRKDLKQKAVDLFRRAMAAPEIRRALTRPSGNVTLWQEKRFEIVIDNRWVSGAFDRVIVVRDDTGKPMRATVLDFKSAGVPDDAAAIALAGQYRPQMQIYRSVLSGMLGLDAAKVTLSLVFVCSGKVHELR